MAQTKPDWRQWVRTKQKWILLCLLGVAILVGGMQFFKPAESKQDAFETIPVAQGALVKSVAATGRVVPHFEVEIKGKASGKIMQLPYDVSDYVEEGALLVQLDPIDESRQVSQAAASLSGVRSRMDQTRLNLQVARQNLSTDIARAKADLQAAEIRLKEAQAKRQRLETLVAKRYISQEEYEAGITAAVLAESELANAQVRLQELETQELALKAQSKDLSIAAAEAKAQQVALATSQQRLDETRIYAPISGVVTSRDGQIGQIVSSGISNVSGGTTIMTLADLSHIFVLASVDESDIGQVRKGQRVHITADAFPGEEFQGEVVQISPKGLEESNVVTFEVKIEVLGDNKDLLKPEMTANVEIILEQKENVVQVPTEAITYDQGKATVHVLEANEKPVPRLVQTGVNNGSMVEILQGLKPGELVVLDTQTAPSRWKKEGSGNNRGRDQVRMMQRMGRR